MSVYNSFSLPPSIMSKLKRGWFFKNMDFKVKKLSKESIELTFLKDGKIDHQVILNKSQSRHLIQKIDNTID